MYPDLSKYLLDKFEKASSSDDERTKFSKEIRSKFAEKTCNEIRRQIKAKI